MFDSEFHTCDVTEKYVWLAFDIGNKNKNTMPTWTLLTIAVEYGDDKSLKIVFLIAAIASLTNHDCCS